MSSDFDETINYIWNTKYDFLGEGSYGKVFRGINRHNGEPVAIKTFKTHNQQLLQLNQEQDMLKALKHKYIIQLLNVETEKRRKMPVFIMELCNDGNLLDFLGRPENVNGLVDEEFLLVLQHLTEGLAYLNEQNIIHRDIKPGNIMRHVQDDGCVIYKLADFGTARELPEGENFESIVGTKQYLHPQIYKAKYLGKKKEFDGKTDLWSIGVTLYHICSCSLPFRVCRNERETMSQIFNELKGNEGLISAVQDTSYPFSIRYNRNLPTSSPLSSGLKQLVTPVIAGLFIYGNRNQQWSFNKYYQAAKEIWSRKVITVLYINTMQIIKMYIRPEDDFEKFQCYINQQTGIDKQHQGFFYKRKAIFSTFQDFPGGITDVVYLYSRKVHIISPIISETCPDLSNFKNKFPTCGQVQYAKRVCKDLEVYKQLIENQSVIYTALSIFAHDFGDYFKQELKKVHQLYDYLMEKCGGIHDKMEILERLESSWPNLNVLRKEFEMTKRPFISQAVKYFNSLKGVEIDAQLSEITYDCYLKIIARELRDMSVSCKSAERMIDDDRYYSIEQIKMVYCVTKVWNTFTNKIRPQFTVFIEETTKWYQNVFYENFKSLQILKKHLYECRYKLKIIEKEVQARVDNNLNCMINNEEVNTLISEQAELLNKFNDIVLEPVQ